jgi:hypothetical protein
MASADTYALQTYQAIGNREDLLDIITDISPTETPMFTRFKRYQASQKKMEWQTDALKTPGSNAAVEGADFTFARPGVRTRVDNLTQIFVNTYSVSGSQDATDVAGVSTEMAYQAQKAMKEHKNDIEYAIVNGTKAAGLTNSARTMDGVIAWITTNEIDENGGVMDEADYNDALEVAWKAGGNPDVTYVGGPQKRKISSYSAGSTKYVDQTDKKLVNTVSVYESDFGMQTIILDRYVPDDKALLLQEDMWGIGVLRASKNVPVAKIADADSAAIVGEYTVVCRNEKASAMISDVAGATPIAS